jgi:transposase
MEPLVQPVGIDVSKKTLDIALPTAARVLSKKGSNTAQEFPALLAWMQAHASGPLHICLEPTSTYHDALVAFLLERGITVSLVPPSRVAAFRRSEGMRHKTDRHDARLLATFCQQKRPAAFVPVPDDLMHLRVLLGRLDQLDQMQQQERNRLENGRLPASICEQLAEHRQQLLTWRTQLMKTIRAWVSEHEPIAQAVRRLQSLKGIGELSAWYLVSVIGPDASRFPSAYQLAIYLGLDVVRHDSGTSVHKIGHISKEGSPRIRRLLGMCALVSKRWDPDMRQWAQELTARGKKSKQVRVAVMRKLLYLAYGVLKSQQTYDPVRAWPSRHPVQQEERPAA